MNLKESSSGLRIVLVSDGKSVTKLKYRRNE